jgi:hypothetical protein
VNANERFRRNDVLQMSPRALLLDAFTYWQVVAIDEVTGLVTCVDCSHHGWRPPASLAANLGYFGGGLTDPKIRVFAAGALWEMVRDHEVVLRRGEATVRPVAIRWLEATA